MTRVYICSPYRQRQLNAIALSVYSSALVAEVLAAAALHVVTTLGLLHPKFAEGTLFQLLPHRKLLEGFIALVGVFRDLIFFAILSWMWGDTAVETILGFALWTGEFLVTIRVKNEGVGTVGRGTPGYIRLLA